MIFFKNLSKLRQLAGKKGQEKLDLTGLLKVFRVFGRHYRKYWKILSVASLFLFATIGVAVLAPWPLKLILDHIILKKALPENFAFLNPLFAGNPKLLLLLLALSIVVIAFLEALFSYIHKFWVSSTGDRITADIRERVFAHLQRLSLSFHEKARSGNLVYLLTADVMEMSKILIDFPQDFTQRVVTFATYAVLMAMLDWRLALVAMCMMPGIYFFTKYFGAGMKKAMKTRRRQEGEVASIIAENLTGMALVQAYGREETEHARFRAENKSSLNAQLQALRMHKTYSRITDLMVTLSTAGVLYWGGRFALGGEILPGTLVIFVAYLRDIYGSFEKFSGLFISLAKSQASAERLLELVENDNVVRDDPKAVVASPFKGRVEFKNVSFAYKDGHNVLKNLNFVVAPGETVALVGHSGAGKSTLISLLLRFYDPQQGQVLIDGQNIRQFTLKSLRDQITIVLQNAKLFRQTVYENIAFGKVGATRQEVIEAAKMAEAHDFIMEMPQGYDTMMYEGGDNLSGGQKQRLNIARAFVRNTPILILDEPLTGLDARTEAKVSAAIQRLTRTRTTFIVAHKFSTIVSADKVLLFEDGELVHQGTHEKLLRESPQYRELYELQHGWQQDALTTACEDNNGQTNSKQVAVKASSV
jgi:ATP-binding cassette subfamily B protein